MNKRIKTVWMLTVISAFLLIVLQGYWLYNSLTYTLQIAEKEMTKRAEEVCGQYKAYLLEVTRKHQQKGYAVTMFIDGISTPATVYSQADNPDSLVGRKKPFFEYTSKLKAPSMDVGIDAANSYISFLIKPFDQKEFLRFATKRLGQDFVSAKLQTHRQVHWQTKVVRHASLLHHEITVDVPINPIDRQTLAMTLHLETQSLLQGMVWQIIGSLVVLLLLLFSLAYLVKVMFWQQHIDQMHSEFVHTMIHELKRPVQTLKMCVSVFSQQDSDENRMVMGMVREESDTLTAYLNKLREVIRAEEHIPLTISTFNLREMLSQLALSTMRNSQKTVDVKVDYQRATDMLTADREQMANVMSNLLENSVKYSAESVNIRISCTENEQGDTVLSVADNGIGIAADEQSKIWQKFYRGKAVARSSQPGIGLGLGLSFVAMVVKAHGGRVGLDSEEGRGTTITINLPQTKA